MAKRIRKSERLPEDRPAALGELIHAQVRVAIETAVHEELAIALGAGRYERHGERRGYRNGVKTRTLTGPTGPLALTLPRATVAATGREWRNEAVIDGWLTRSRPGLSCSLRPTMIGWSLRTNPPSCTLGGLSGQRWVTFGRSRGRESRSLGSVGAKAEWLSYPTTTLDPGDRHYWLRYLSPPNHADAFDGSPILAGRPPITSGRDTGSRTARASRSWPPGSGPGRSIYWPKGARRPSSRPHAPCFDRGDYVLALTLLDLGLMTHPASPALAGLRRQALDGVRARHQQLNPFKFIIYSEWAGADLLPVE